MTINDMFHIYALKNSTDTDGMLQDYVLDSRLNRDALNGKILLELGDMIPYYNDTVVMKFAIDNWFLTHYKNITKLLDAIEAEYDFLTPMEIWEENEYEGEKTEENNKNITDRKITEYKETDDNEEKLTYGKVENYDSKDVTSGNTTTGYGHITENVISAYDASSYQPQNKNIESGTDTETYNNITNAKSGKDYLSGTDTNKQDNEKTIEEDITNTETGKDRDFEGHNSDTENKHKWGRDVDDIADLVNSQIKLAKFNIYQWICDRLEEKICLGIF